MRGDVLKMLIVYKFITTDSPDAKLTIDILDQRHFAIHARGKSLRGKTVINIEYKKKEIY